LDFVLARHDFCYLASEAPMNPPFTNLRSLLAVTAFSIAVLAFLAFVMVRYNPVTEKLIR
jgi:hypothetical protein